MVGVVPSGALIDGKEGMQIARPSVVPEKGPQGRVCSRCREVRTGIKPFKKNYGRVPGRREKFLSRRSSKKVVCEKGYAAKFHCEWETIWEAGRVSDAPRRIRRKKFSLYVLIVNTQKGTHHQNLRLVSIKKVGVIPRLLSIFYQDFGEGSVMLK